jgi:hypothetical protein
MCIPRNDVFQMLCVISHFFYPNVFFDPNTKKLGFLDLPWIYHVGALEYVKPLDFGTICRQSHMKFPQVTLTNVGFGLFLDEITGCLVYQRD